jgi:hypothetical protein
MSFGGSGSFTALSLPWSSVSAFGPFLSADVAVVRRVVMNVRKPADVPFW